MWSISEIGGRFVDLPTKLLVDYEAASLKPFVILARWAMLWPCSGHAIKIAMNLHCTLNQKIFLGLKPFHSSGSSCLSRFAKCTNFAYTHIEIALIKNNLNAIHLFIAFNWPTGHRFLYLSIAFNWMLKCWPARPAIGQYSRLALTGCNWRRPQRALRMPFRLGWPEECVLPECIGSIVR